MDSPKEKIRANIYKKLLEEEKRKNKKISVFSLSVFVVGVFTGTSYNLLRRDIITKNQVVAFKNKTNLKKQIKEQGFTIDDLFQVDGIKIDKKDFNSENLFVSDLQI